MISEQEAREAPCKIRVGDSFACPCGTEQPKLDGWVAANWDERLVGKCEKCGTEFTIRRGKVRIVKHGKITERPA
jgi:hypothetical protein